VSPNKSLLRAGGRWYLVCESLAGLDKVPMISFSEPPGAELSRWATLRRCSFKIPQIGGIGWAA
jgi:hypothetical protein